MKPLDIHTHLFKKYYKKDFERVVEKTSNELEKILNVACDLEMLSELLENKYPENIYFSAGFHPHEADRITDKELNFLKKILKTYPKFIALGEIGLDFFKNYSSQENQYLLLEKQLIMAKELDLPLIIHCRDAYPEMYQILKDFRKDYHHNILLHCYSGGIEHLDKFLELDCFFSLGGTITFKNNKSAPSVLKSIPLEKLFPETDAPYLTPHPYRGKKNYPFYVKLVLEKMAEILNLSPEILNENFSKNWNIFFKKADNN